MSLLQPTKIIALACNPETSRRKNYILGSLQFYAITLALAVMSVIGWTIHKNLGVALVAISSIFCLLWIWTGFRMIWARICNCRGKTKNSLFFVVAFVVISLLPLLNFVSLLGYIALWCLDSHDDYPKQSGIN